jgi:hypothetical protein
MALLIALKSIIKALTKVFVSRLVFSLFPPSTMGRENLIMFCFFISSGSYISNLNYLFTLND